MKKSKKGANIPVDVNLKPIPEKKGKGVKIRGTGAAKKGITARGPMG